MKTKLKTLKTFVSIMLLLCMIKPVRAQITFQKTIGSFWQFTSVQQTTDGGFIATGQYGALVKTDINGDTLWVKRFYGGYIEAGNEVQQTADGGYIILGYQDNPPYNYFYLVKTDSAGILLWSKIYHYYHIDVGHSVQQTSDGGYILAGEFRINTSQAGLIKIDSLGAVMWTKVYGGSISYAASVEQTTDSGFIFTGIYRVGTSDVYVVKTDVNGDSLWAKKYGNIQDDWGCSIQQTFDGGYIIAGVTKSFGAGLEDIYLLKIDGNGNLTWSKTYGTTGIERPYFVQQTSDSGYVVVGYTRFVAGGATDEDVYLIKTDANGDELWTKTYGGANYERGFGIRQTSDGGYIIAGQTHSFGLLPWSGYLIKTDANGNSGCNENTINTIITSPATIITDMHEAYDTSGVIALNVATTMISNGSLTTQLCFAIGTNEIMVDPSFAVFPNPFNNEITTQGTKQDGVIKILDYTGKLVLKKKTLNMETKINTAFLSPGFYLLSYLEKNKIINIKLVKF